AVRPLDRGVRDSIVQAQQVAVLNDGVIGDTPARRSWDLVGASQYAGQQHAPDRLAIAAVDIHCAGEIDLLRALDGQLQARRRVGARKLALEELKLRIAFAVRHHGVSLAASDGPSARELLLPWSDVLQRPMDLVGVGDGEDLRAALQRPLRTDEEAFERGLVPAQAREIALDELDLVLAGHGDIGVLLVMAAGGAGVLGRAA